MFATEDSFLLWAASWVPDDPVGQRQRFLEALRTEFRERMAASKRDGVNAAAKEAEAEARGFDRGVDAAAKECDAAANTWEGQYTKDDHAAERSRSRVSAARQCATWIRALSGKGAP